MGKLKRAGAAFFVRAAESPNAGAHIEGAADDFRRIAEAAYRSDVEGQKMPKVNRVLWNERGKDIDEIVMCDVDMVHVEQMDDRCWWIGIYLPDGRFWTGNFTCDSRGRMTFTEQDRAIAWDKDESHDER